MGRNPSFLPLRYEFWMIDVTNIAIIHGNGIVLKGKDGLSLEMSTQQLLLTLDQM